MQPLVLDPAAPRESAKALVDRWFSTQNGRTLHHYRGDFYHWSGAAYVLMPLNDLRSWVYAFLDDALRRGRRGGWSLSSRRRARSAT